MLSNLKNYCQAVSYPKVLTSYLNTTNNKLLQVGLHNYDILPLISNDFQYVFVIKFFFSFERF